MNSCYALLAECLSKEVCPESILFPTQEKRPLPEGFSLAECDRIYTENLVQRLPKVFALYITLAGNHAAELVAQMSQEFLVLNHADNQEEQRYSMIRDLYEAGISLSWWFFGIGNPLWLSPKLAEWPEQVSIADAVRTLRYMQGWSDLESRWLITQTHEASQHKLAHRVICRVMTSMPPIRFFPTMPDVLSVFDRIKEAIQSFVVPADAEEWLADSIALLQQSPWRACVLMLVRQGSISHWKVRQKPRRKSERLAFVIALLFDLYGYQDGLEFYLRVLNEEAKTLGFLSLAEVVRGVVWTSSSKKAK